MKSGAYTENELGKMLREDISKFKKNIWLHADFDFMVIPNDTSSKIDNVVMVDNLVVKEVKQEITDEKWIKGYKSWEKKNKLTSVRFNPL